MTISTQPRLKDAFRWQSGVSAPDLAAASYCEFLEWDSNFFKQRIARVTTNRLDGFKTKNIMEWCHTQKIDCLYFLADADDDLTVRIAEAQRFHFVDIRVSFEKQLDGAPAQMVEPNAERIRPATLDDIPALQEIARTCYRHTRFYYDAHFPVQRADALYGTWIEKSCKGYADMVFVGTAGDKPAGYISCHLPDAATGQIGLVGVRPDSSGLGLGQQLVNHALSWFAQQNVRRVRVATQARNSQAQRLYERCGFLTQSFQLWYHRWFTSAGT